MLFRTSPLKWKRCNKAEPMPWVRPSSGHLHTTQCGIHPVGPPLQQGWLWGSPAPETSETPHSCQTQQCLVHCPYGTGALAVPPLAHSQRCPTAPGHGSHSPGATHATLPSPNPCYGCSSLRSPWAWRDPNPCRHEHLLPSPTHHLRPAEQSI